MAADVVVLPGRMAGTWSPLPLYTSKVAEERGATVHRHEWTCAPPAEPERLGWVRGEVGPLLDKIGGRPLVIAKSLGTNAAAVAAERDLPAIWLTPLLHLPHVVTALGRATAPFLLVGGDADTAWDADVARRLTPHVFEVPGADHGLYVPGPVSASIAVLSRVVEATEEFFDEIGWPKNP
ncbi:alpha/beta hydrolase [Actinoplanes sp. NPDC026619]|uniref:alpha/beta hydrolase n=1 Tax=Actinoplanes sp. NPDC026619 TaxID=3155798 RepID=UPI0033E76330